MNSKIFGVRDLVYILGIAAGLFANWYSMDTRITMVEAENLTIKKTVDENAELTKKIYLGLIAKGVISPPTD